MKNTAIYMGGLITMVVISLVSILMSGLVNATTYQDGPTTFGQDAPLGAWPWADHTYGSGFNINYPISQNGDDLIINSLLDCNNGQTTVWDKVYGQVDYYYNTALVDTDNVDTGWTAPLSSGHNTSSTYTFVDISAGDTITINYCIRMLTDFGAPVGIIGFGFVNISMTYNIYIPVP